MRLLLDTHLLLWWLGWPERVPGGAREAVAAAEHVHVSHASLWEMAIKCSLGKLAVDLPALHRQVEVDGFEWLPISAGHLLAVAELPQHEDHRDPFDRLLVAQAATEPLILLTADSKLARYGAMVRLV